MNRALLRFSVAAAAFAFAALARAAEESHAVEGGTVGFKWVHFVILALAVAWLFVKVLPPFLRRNADEISSAISRATAAKTEADKLLAAAAAKLASLEKEVAEFRALAQKESMAEIGRLLAATAQDTEKIAAAAKAEIEAAERAARVELKALAAKLAVDGAESLVSKELTPAVQEAMLSNFVQSLQGRPN